MIRLIFALTICSSLIFSCSKERKSDSNNQKVAKLIEKYGIQPDQIQLDLPDDKFIPDDEWLKFEDQLSELGVGARFKHQVSVYTKTADPFIMELMVNTEYTSEEDYKRRLAIAEELQYTKHGKSVKELLEIVVRNKEYFPNELISNLKSSISNGDIKDAPWTKEDLLLIESASQNK